VVAGIEAKEVLAHLRQFFGAIGRQRFGRLIIGAARALFLHAVGPITARQMFGPPRDRLVEICARPVDHMIGKTQPRRFLGAHRQAAWM
jgi:hypothetical protein